MQSLYIIGPPGAGKTHLLNSLLYDIPQVAVTQPGSTKHTRYWPDTDFRGIQLGVAREGGFGGTDSLPFNAITALEIWLSQDPPDYLVAEGDRLANDRFFRFLGDLGPLHVILAVCSEETLSARLGQRGSTQNPHWLRGRRTKVENLLSKWSPTKISTEPSLVPMLLSHPVIHGIRNRGNTWR